MKTLINIKKWLPLSREATIFIFHQDKKYYSLIIATSSTYNLLPIAAL